MLSRWNEIISRLRMWRPVLLSALSCAVIMMVLGYSAYGWFSIAKSVRATDMKMEITIAGMQLTTAENPTEQDWSESIRVDLNDFVKINNTDNKTNHSFQKGQDTFYLFPASSLTGFDQKVFTSSNSTVFYSEDSAKMANMSLATSGYYDQPSSSFIGNYVDVPIYFRCNYGSNHFDLYLSEDSDIHSENNDTISQTVRVAFLNCNDQTTNSFLDKNPTNQYVYALRKQGEARAVFDTNASLSNPTFLNFTNGISDQKLLDSTVNGQIAKNGYAGLVLRIWIEGQDDNCVAGIGSKSFTVDLNFLGEAKGTIE